MIAATGSSRLASTTTSAPMRRAISRRPAMRSTPITVVAPLSLAPAVAHRPIGPCANTATVSPMRMPPLSAPPKPVDMMSGHISTCSSVSPSGTTARLFNASGTSTYSAWQPSMVLPNRQPPSGFQPCAVPAPSCAPQPH